MENRLIIISTLTTLGRPSCESKKVGAEFKRRSTETERRDWAKNSFNMENRQYSGNMLTECCCRTINNSS